MIIIIVIIIIIINIIIIIITIIRWIDNEFLFEITTILQIIINTLYIYKYNNQNVWNIIEVTRILFVDILYLFR